MGAVVIFIPYVCRINPRKRNYSCCEVEKDKSTMLNVVGINKGCVKYNVTYNGNNSEFVISAVWVVKITAMTY